MTIKLLQLNMNADNFWDQFTSFLLPKDFDIINLQEVTGKDTVSGNIHSKRDVFPELQKLLQETYNGELSISQRFTSSSDSYMGNATFYKKHFSLLEKNEIVLSNNEKPFPSEATSYESEGQKVLHLKLEIENKKISFLNSHLGWAKTPKEEPHQTQQGKILLNYLQKIQKPFILAGDFNLDPKQPTIQKISQLARNLTSEYHIENTLNPRTHYAKNLFPPGVAVDYIFTTRDLSVKNFTVIEKDISDHFGLTVEIEI